LCLKYRAPVEKLASLALQKTPGSECLLTDGGKIIERGSIWYWLNNKHLYNALEWGINRALWEETPLTAQIAGVPNTGFCTTPEKFTVTDEWVAADPINRLKMGWITVVVEAPIPIRTQLFKHKHGFVENEVSRRYVDTPPTFYSPDFWRSRAPNIKQGSLPTPLRQQTLARWVEKIVYTVSRWGYRSILSLNGCPEQARFLLAQGMMTQWYWTASLNAAFRAIHLRTDPHAQVETCQLARQLHELISKQWPQTCQKLSWMKSAAASPK
jgi:thymidylate synthase (FAD)